jgi:endonuclease/exonuclease/phosphatase family metal-dependent hydrolase
MTNEGKHERMLIRGLVVYWFLCCALVCPALAELPSEIRVVTYNIHHGEGTDRKFDLPRIAKLILAEKPDIVAIQEMDQGTRRSSRVDQPAELARQLQMQVVFGRNIDFDGGGYGTAVFTKLPIRSSESVKLKSYYPPTRENPEQRGVQVIELGNKDEPGLLFLCTHLDYRPPDEERMNSALAINELIKQRSEPAIIAGDFNATPESRVIHEFAKEWKIVGEAGDGKASDGAGAAEGSIGGSLLTFPSAKPDRQIDYIMCRPANRWEVVEVRVLDEPVASDHRPLLAVLRLKP